ncbi:MAG: LLM class flavin-dependent oxidoreductase [Aggregatilineales bacterium]
MPDRVGLYLQDTYTLQDSIKYVQRAETRGFYAVWQAESRLSRDALVALASYAVVTNRIKLGTGVINLWTRNPATIAAACLSLDDLAPDRIMLGLGAWYDPLASQVGIKRTKPLFAMREVVRGVRELLTLEHVNFAGEFVRLNNVGLDVVDGRTQPRRVPIFVGATGPRMMAVAGEIADGVILNHLVSPQYNVGALQQLRLGADKARRSLDDIERPQIIVISVERDNRELALNRARKLVTQYIRQQPEVMRASGVRAGLIDEIAQVLPLYFTESQLNDAMRLVPDSVVQLVTASGTPDEVRAKVKAYMDSGATYPVLYPLGDVNYTIDVFSNGYSKVDDPLQEFSN